MRDEQMQGVWPGGEVVLRKKERLWGRSGKEKVQSPTLPLNEIRRIAFWEYMFS